MTTAEKKTLDFNSLLVLANVVIVACTIVAYRVKGPNPYIDQYTIWLAAALACQTHIALFLEKRWRDPFVVLLAFLMVFYFSLRILTLSLYPYSVVFQRFDYDAGNSNYAAIFIILANTMLYAGFFAAKLRNGVINVGSWTPHRPSAVVALVALTILFAYTKDNYWIGDNVPRALRYLEVLLSPNIVLLMAVAYYLLMRKSLSRPMAWTILLLVLLDAVLHTLAGSRSAIVEIIKNYIIVGLAIGGAIRVNRKYSIVALVAVPLVVALLVVSFTFASFVRANRGADTGGSFDVGRAIDLYDSPEFELSDFDKTLPPLFDRVGFFDYSAEIIAHRDIYSSIINIELYGKSLVDNLLTPGFDVFDQPKISNSLKFAYQDLGPPSKLAVMEGYQSDQIGLYGELYILFGYAALPLFFLLAYLLKRIYIGFKVDNPFNLVMKRTIALYLFVAIVNSFGLDWIVIDILIFALSVWLYRLLFQVKPYETAPALQPA